MEGGLTDVNRQHCAEAAKPLFQAVETLTTFAVSPEFASSPATISAKVGDSVCCLQLYFTLSLYDLCFSAVTQLTVMQDIKPAIFVRDMWPL